MPEKESDSRDERQARSLALEKAYVHDVYNQMAPHFTDTRYRAWPRVKQFLLDLEPGCLVADVGCGNGKYLDVNSDVFKVGSDRCEPLTKAAQLRHHEVITCDNLQLPFRDESFDAALSVAVIHHFATTDRRVEALRELARILRIGGKVMITVWAMEQRHRKFDSQDVLVPWHQPVKSSSEDRGSSVERELTSTTTSDDDILVYHAYSHISDTDSRRHHCHRAHSPPTPSVANNSTTASTATTRAADVEAPSVVTNSGSGRRRPKLRNGRGRYRAGSFDTSCANNNNSSQSSSELSSPNETCYSFVRRALQKLSSTAGKPHPRRASDRTYFYRSCRRPWFSDSMDFGMDPKSMESSDLERQESLDSEGGCPDLEDVPIELRHLEGDESCPHYGSYGDASSEDWERRPPVCATCLPLDLGSPGKKSRSLGDFLNIIPRILRARRGEKVPLSELHKRISTASDPREYVIKSHGNVNGIVRSKSTVSFMSRLEELMALSGGASDSKDRQREQRSSDVPLRPKTVRPVLPSLTSSDFANGNTITAAEAAGQEVCSSSQPDGATSECLNLSDSNENQRKSGGVVDNLKSEHTVASDSESDIGRTTGAVSNERSDPELSTSTGESSSNLGDLAFLAGSDDSVDPPGQEGHLSSYYSMPELHNIRDGHYSDDNLFLRMRRDFQGQRSANFFEHIHGALSDADGGRTGPAGACELDVAVRRESSSPTDEEELGSMSLRGSFVKRSLSVDTGDNSGPVLQGPRRFSASAVQGSFASTLRSCLLTKSSSRGSSVKSDTSGDSEESIISVIPRKGNSLQSDTSMDSEESIISVIQRSTSEIEALARENSLRNNLSRLGSRSAQASPITVLSSQASSTESSPPQSGKGEGRFFGMMDQLWELHMRENDASRLVDIADSHAYREPFVGRRLMKTLSDPRTDHMSCLSADHHSLRAGMPLMTLHKIVDSRLDDESDEEQRSITPRPQSGLSLDDPCGDFSLKDASRTPSPNVPHDHIGRISPRAAYLYVRPEVTRQKSSPELSISNPTPFYEPAKSVSSSPLPLPQGDEAVQRPSSSSPPLHVSASDASDDESFSVEEKQTPLGVGSSTENGEPTKTGEVIVRKVHVKVIRSTSNDTLSDEATDTSTSSSASFEWSDFSGLAARNGVYPLVYLSSESTTTSSSGHEDKKGDSTPSSERSHQSSVSKDSISDLDALSQFSSPMILQSSNTAGNDSKFSKTWPKSEKTKPSLQPPTVTTSSDISVSKPSLVDMSKSFSALPLHSGESSTQVPLVSIEEPPKVEDKKTNSGTSRARSPNKRTIMKRQRNICLHDEMVASFEKLSEKGSLARSWLFDSSECHGIINVPLPQEESSAIDIATNKDCRNDQLKDASKVDHLGTKTSTEKVVEKTSMENTNLSFDKTPQDKAIDLLFLDGKTEIQSNNQHPNSASNNLNRKGVSSREENLLEEYKCDFHNVPESKSPNEVHEVDGITAEKNLMEFSEEPREKIVSKSPTEDNLNGTTSPLNLLEVNLNGTTSPLNLLEVNLNGTTSPLNLLDQPVEEDSSNQYSSVVLSQTAIQPLNTERTDISPHDEDHFKNSDITSHDLISLHENNSSETLSQETAFNKDTAESLIEPQITDTAVPYNNVDGTVYSALQSTNGNIQAPLSKPSHIKDTVLEGTEIQIRISSNSEITLSFTDPLPSNTTTIREECSGSISDGVEKSSQSSQDSSPISDNAPTSRKNYSNSGAEVRELFGRKPYRKSFDQVFNSKTSLSRYIETPNCSIVKNHRLSNRAHAKGLLNRECKSCDFSKHLSQEENGSEVLFGCQSAESLRRETGNSTRNQVFDINGDKVASVCEIKTDEFQKKVEDAEVLEGQEKGEKQIVNNKERVNDEGMLANGATTPAEEGGGQKDTEISKDSDVEDSLRMSPEVTEISSTNIESEKPGEIVLSEEPCNSVVYYTKSQRSRSSEVKGKSRVSQKPVASKCVENLSADNGEINGKGIKVQNEIEDTRTPETSVRSHNGVNGESFSNDEKGKGRRYSVKKCSNGTIVNDAQPEKSAEFPAKKSAVNTNCTVNSHRPLRRQVGSRKGHLQNVKSTHERSIVAGLMDPGCSTEWSSHNVKRKDENIHSQNKKSRKEYGLCSANNLLKSRNQEGKEFSNCADSTQKFVNKEVSTAVNVASDECTKQSLHLDNKIGHCSGVELQSPHTSEKDDSQKDCGSLQTESVESTHYETELKSSLEFVKPTTSRYTQRVPSSEDGSSSPSQDLSDVPECSAGKLFPSSSGLEALDLHDCRRSVSSRTSSFEDDSKSSSGSGDLSEPYGGNKKKAIPLTKDPRQRDLQERRQIFRQVGKESSDEKDGQTDILAAFVETISDLTWVFSELYPRHEEKLEPRIQGPRPRSSSFERILTAPERSTECKKVGEDKHGNDRGHGTNGERRGRLCEEVSSDHGRNCSSSTAERTKDRKTDVEFLRSTTSNDKNSKDCLQSQRDELNFRNPRNGFIAVPPKSTETDHELQAKIYQSEMSQKVTEPVTRTPSLESDSVPQDSSSRDCSNSNDDLDDIPQDGVVIDIGPDCSRLPRQKCPLDESTKSRPTLSRTTSPSLSTSQESLQGSEMGGTMAFHRYYHVFREGELDNLIENYVENLHIISSYYDHANWCIIAEKVQVWTI